MQELKAFNIRIPKEIWLFVKKQAAEQETSMMEIILTQLNKYKKSYEKRLTNE